MKNQTVMRAIVISGCVLFASGAGNAADAMNAEFSTMAKCLEGIKKSSGQELKIVTDKPSEVSGFLANGQGFGCQRTESGSKGTYYRGWYMVK